MFVYALCSLLIVASADENATERVGDDALDADVEARAKSLFKVGGNAYEAGQYEVAIRAFEEAYSVARRPEIVFSLAQSHRLQFVADGDGRKLERAVALYREYLREAPAGRRRKHAIEHLAALQPFAENPARAPTDTRARVPNMREVATQKRTQLVIATSIAGARASVDRADLRDLPAIFDVAPGTHTIRVEASGYETATREMLAVEGELVAVDLDLEPKPAIVQVDAPDGAEVVVDGRSSGNTPFANGITMSAGDHHVAILDNGKYPFVREIDVARGEALTLSVELETTTQRKVSYGVLGTSVALLGAATVAAILASARHSDARDIESMLDRGTALTVADVEHHDGYERQRDNAATIAVISGAGAVITAAIGVVLVLFDTPRQGASSNARGTTSGPRVDAAPSLR